MKNSLLFKLLGAFLIVIAMGALVMTWLTSRATEKAFSLYTTRNGQYWAEILSPSLADFYLNKNSWQGVAAYLQTFSGVNMNMGAGGMMGQGRGFGKGSTNGNAVMSMSGQRLILADAAGTVIADTGGSLIGNLLEPGTLSSGAPILANGEQVGTLVVTPDTLVAGTPASDFLTSVNKAIMSSAGIAAVLALIIGALLFLQIISPVRKLNQAAAAITAGDLDQRVSIKSQDELGDLGSSFNRMAESLSKAEDQRKNMIADVAHELRTPLAAMQGTLEGIQDGLMPFDREQVDSLLAETTLLTRMVGDLRLLSLADAGELVLEKRMTSPGSLFESIVERARSLAQVKGISLNLSLQPDLPSIWVDPDRITQLVNNLITNALRYTPRNGEIRLNVAHAEGDSSLQISITDTGPGIDASDLPYVFDRFYRAEKSRSRSSGGSGLGLAIVRQLVEAHGGKVAAESPVFTTEDGTCYGTRISFSLPLGGN